MARIYPDSKTFVDKKLLYPEETIVTKYRALKEQTNNHPSVDQLKTFVDENFADDKFEPWVPPDFNPKPSVVNNIADEAFRKWVLELNQIWKELAQKMPKDVLENPDRHSFLYIPNGFIKVRCMVLIGGQVHFLHFSVLVFFSNFVILLFFFFTETRYSIGKCNFDFEITCCTS